jgi:prophage maintenance system killer protein
MRVADAPPPDETRLKLALDRATEYAQRQRGDIITVAGPMLYELVKAKPFGSRSNQAAMALTLTFLMRHGVVIAAPMEDLVEVSAAISGGQIYLGVLDQWMRESARLVN